MGRNDDVIPEAVQAQLLAVGIPSTKHRREVLAGFFPNEFNIAAAGLNTEDLARVLVHFAENGIISVGDRVTAIKEVVPGWHFCRFYRSDQELVDLIAPYIVEGLQNHEGCFWVLPESVTNDAACAALARTVGNVDGYLASGQLEMMNHRDWYLDEAGRLKAFDRVSEGLLAKQNGALARGFKFLRAAGDTGWVSGTEESKAFIDYELKINAALGATKIAAVCTYRSDVTADELVAIVTAHQGSLSSSLASA